MTGQGASTALCRILARDGVAIVAPDGREAPVKSRKALAIVAYLALGPSRSATREKLCGLLWSERPEPAARGALRQCLHRLAEDLSPVVPGLVQIGRDTVTLAAELARTDLEELLEGIAGDAPTVPLDPELFGQDRILDGYDMLDPSFTAWLRVLRESWHERFTSALARGMERPDLPPEARTALARTLFAIDPTHQPAARLLIEAHMREANPTSALRVYRTLWDALGEQWDEEPSDELQALIARARNPEPAAPGPPARATPSPAEPARTAPVLLIEPFAQTGPWDRPAYFAEGFRRELIAALVRFREWVVADALSVGDHSGADYAIGCGYRQAGAAALLTVTMLDRRTGGYVMSDQVTLAFESWGESLERIIRRTAVSLNIHLSKRRTQTGTAREPPPLGVFDLWLRANELRRTWRPETFDEAERLFREVIAVAPDYAPGYSSLAGLMSTRHLAAPGIERRNEWEAAAREFAQRSVSLDPLDARNQHALAWANAMQGAYSQAEFNFDLCLELNPASPRTMMPCAHGYSFLGLHDRANALADQALEIHPSMLAPHWGYLMCIRFFAGRWREAIEAGEQAGDSILDLPAWRAASHAMAGDHLAGRSLMEAFVETARSRWAGPSRFSPEALARWFLHAFPIRHREDLALLREGLAQAGLEARAGLPAGAGRTER